VPNLPVVGQTRALEVRLRAVAVPLDLVPPFQP